MKSSVSWSQSVVFCATICHSSICKKRAKAANLVTQLCLGHPAVWRPSGVHLSTRWIQLSCGTEAKCIANFQWWVRERWLHSFMPCSNVIDCTLPFQSWRISCHGRDQSRFEGGPTTARRNLRQAASNWCRSFWWTVRCPEPKSATGLTTASKYLSRAFTCTFRSQRIVLLAKNALEAACKWWLRSTVVLPAFPTPRMHPSHLCPPDSFFTCNLIPVRVHKCDGGWASLVNTTVFSLLYINVHQVILTRGGGSSLHDKIDEILQLRVREQIIQSSVLPWSNVKNIMPVSNQHLAAVGRLEE